MNGGIIGTIIYFWAFIIGVIIFGKIFGYMNDTKTAIMVLIAAAIVFIVWIVGRKMAAIDVLDDAGRARRNAIVR